MESILKKLPFDFFKRKSVHSLTIRFENDQLEDNSMSKLKAGTSRQFSEFISQSTATCGSTSPQ